MPRRKGPDWSLQRDDRALLDLRVLGSRQFTISVVAMLLGMATMMGTFIVVPYFAQSVILLDSFQTGLITLPGGRLMGLAGPIVGRIYDQHGPRVLAFPGSVLVSIGVWMLNTVDTSTSIWWLLLSNMALCVGLACTFTPLMPPPRARVHRFPPVFPRFRCGRHFPAGCRRGRDGTVHHSHDAGVLSFVLITVCCFVRKPTDAEAQ